MSATAAGAACIESFTPAADYTGKEGYGVTATGGVATIGTSATVPHHGIILQGADTNGKVIVALCGYHQPVWIKVSGNVTKGEFMKQHTNGTYVADNGSGTRVVGAIAMEAGKSGDLIRAAFLGAPYPLAS